MTQFLEHGWQRPIPCGGSKSGGTQTTTSQVVLPDWLQSAAQSSLQNAQTVAQRPYQANPDLSVAPLTQDQQNAYATIAGMQGNTQPLYQASEQAYQGLLGSAQPLTAQGISGTAQQLMSPYTSQVVDPSVALMRQQLGQSMAGNAAQAANVGAFGGSRLGVQQGVAQSQEALQAGQLQGQLLQSGWGQALNTAYGMGQTNLQAGLTAAGALPGVATAANADLERQAALLEGAGRAQQGQQQAVSDLAAQQWQTQWDYPWQQQQYVEQALTSTPYGGTTISTGPTATKNVAGSILGGAASGAAAGSAFGPWGTAIGGVGGGLLGAFS